MNLLPRFRGAFPPRIVARRPPFSRDRSVIHKSAHQKICTSAYPLIKKSAYQKIRTSKKLPIHKIPPKGYVKFSPIFVFCSCKNVSLVLLLPKQWNSTTLYCFPSTFLPTHYFEQIRSRKNFALFIFPKFDQ